MKCIGLIGGMSWESSAQYYAIINRAVRDRLGAPHSAKSVMVSLDFGEVERLQHKNDWSSLRKLLAESTMQLEAGGADCIVLCTNTMHKLASSIEEASPLPLIHIADPTASAIISSGIKKVGLLGTAFTMEHDFYRGRLSQKHGLEVLIPMDDDRAEVHRVIYEELVAGKVRDTSRDAYREIIASLVDAGAEGIILGCTEIMLLVGEEDSTVPLFDTTRLHAEAAVEFALG